MVVCAVKETNPQKIINCLSSSTEGFNMFQIIILVLQPTTLPFWFTFTALINLIKHAAAGTL